MEQDYERRRRQAMRKRRQMIRRKKQIARRMLIAVSVLIIFAVILIIKLFFVNDEKSPLKADITLEAGDKLPDISAFLADSEYKPDVIAGLEDAAIMNKVGDYIITVKKDDKEWKSILHVKDTMPPVVVTKDVTAFTGKTITPEDFIESIDDKTDCTKVFVQTPDMSAEGERTVKIRITDEGGNAVEKEALLTVNKDEEAPVIEGVGDIVVPVGSTVSYKKNVTVTDNSGEEIALNVDNSNVDLDKEGKYEVTYTATDASGNMATKTVKVIVTSADAPTEEEVNRLADAILEQILTDDMTQKEKAEKIYWWVHDNIGYVDSSVKNNWVESAYQGLKQRKGDCYTYAMTSKALLTRAGIKNMEISKIPTKTSHYWNLIDIGEGWYHFDTTRRKDGTTFFYWTSEQIIAYSNANYGSHNYDATQYPKIN